MLLSRRIDFFNPKVVRFARYVLLRIKVRAFISSFPHATCVVLLNATDLSLSHSLSCNKLFIVYVRIMAKSMNDRTPIVTTNPLSGLVNSQLGQKQGGDMVKDLASQFLSSKTTVMEYDLKQAKSMNGGLLINMAFMWFLHFKMEQTQPLFAQTLTGVLQSGLPPLVPSLHSRTKAGASI